LRDEPFVCGIDIEPYIYLSGTETSQEITVSDESVLDELLSGDYLKRWHAADAINKMPDSEKQQFLNIVISKLKNEDVAVRRNAAWALGRIGDVDALTEALKDETVEVRRAAAKALGAVGDVGAVGALTEALKDENVEVRRTAAKALGVIGDVDALTEALKDETVYVRRTAAKALEKIKAKHDYTGT